MQTKDPKNRLVVCVGDSLTRGNVSFDFVDLLEKRLGLHLEAQDVFLNVAGGIKIDDPAVDLAVVMAIASAFLEQMIMPEAVVIGEVGLAGEIRSISQASLRIQEAEKLGFKHCIMPQNNFKNLNYKGSIELVPASTLKEAQDIILTGGK